MRRPILPKLGKAYVLVTLQQSEIFSRFMGISQSVIDNCTDRGTLIVSPLRSDKSATCGFKYRANGTLVFKDFAGYFHGDCFDLVGYIINEDARTSRGFGKILEAIAREFRIHHYATATNYVAPTPPNVLIERVVKLTTIEVEVRHWNRSDGLYWGQYNFNREYLKKWNVYPLDTVWVNNQIVYIYNNDKNPAYGYYFGNVDGRQLWKIYYPKKKDFRFVTNCDVVQGISQLTETDTIVITKSYKDVMAINHYSPSLLQALAPSSESVLMPEHQIEYLRTKAKRLVTLFDYDLAGIKATNKYRKKYGTIPFYFPHYFGGKDFTDVMAERGYQFMQDLIELVIGYDYNLETDFFNDLNQLLNKSDSE